jgi:hypothetical protein
LSLGVPNDRRAIEKDEDPRLRSSGYFIHCTVSINKAIDLHWITMRRRSISWYDFLGITVEIGPIMSLKCILITINP